jgi:trypsin-like peptidase
MARGVLVAALLALGGASSARAADAPSESQLDAVYDRSVDAVVLIESDERTGCGFFFRDSRHVVTALHVVDDVDAIRVRTASGARVNARVVAYSRLHDLALLELEQAAVGVPVLSPAKSARVGEPVAVIGHPFSNLARSLPQLRGLLEWSLSQGIVSAVSGSWLQTDAAVNPGNSGGPALNAEGQVLGVVSAKLSEGQGIAMIARISRVEPLFERIDQEPPPRQVVRWDKLEVAFLVQWAEAPLNGFGLGGGVRLWKDYPVQLRAGFVTGDVPPEAPTVLSSTLDRLTLELSAGYALALGSTLSLSAQLGAALLADRRRDTSLAIDAPIVCAETPCVVAGEVQRSTEHDVGLLPMVALALDLGPVRAGYAYQLDLTSAGHSQHRALLALTF